MNTDYDKILDNELARIQLRRAIIRATSANDIVDAELSKPEYQAILTIEQEYREKAKLLSSCSPSQ